SLARPGELHQFEIFRSPPVTLGLRAEVAISLLLVVGLAGDDVHDEPSVGQMVERRDLAGHQGRRNESRPMRYEVAELLCVRGSVKRATRNPSADDEVQPTSAKSKPASSCARANCVR